jgi:hypothetical protein
VWIFNHLNHDLLDLKDFEENINARGYQIGSLLRFEVQTKMAL